MDKDYLHPTPRCWELSNAFSESKPDPKVMDRLGAICPTFSWLCSLLQLHVLFNHIVEQITTSCFSSI